MAKCPSDFISDRHATLFADGPGPVEMKRIFKERKSFYSSFENDQLQKGNVFWGVPQLYLEKLYRVGVALEYQSRPTCLPIYSGSYQ